jgi:hypothetical protein
MEINVGYDVIGTSRNEKNGALSLNLGSSSSPVTYSTGAELWQTFGFASLPSNPTNGKPSAQTLSFERNIDIVFAARDLRSTKIYGELKPGETCVYSTGPTGNSTNRFFLKDNGTKATQTMMCQAGNTSTGKPVMVQINSEDGGKVNIAAGDNAAIVLDSNGIQFATKGVLQLGGTGDLVLRGNSLALNGSNVSLGAGAVAGVGNVALAPNLIIDLAAIHAWIAAVTAAFAPATPLGILLAASGLAPPVVTAGGVVSGLTATLPLIQSTSVVAAQ